MEKIDLNILVVEDNNGDARLVSEMLSGYITLSFKISRAGLLNEALNILKKEKFDIILLDLDLPDSRGLDTLEKITRQDNSIPIVVLTGNDDENIGTQAIQRKAADYLVKGRIQGDLLTRTIRYSIERKNAEKILRKAHDELELRVRERTTELMTAQLELEKAKRLSDIGALAATVAHELRNPLNTIQMAVHNIRRKTQDPSLERSINNIENKIIESEQIINNLLFYSKIRIPNYENVNFYEILNECVDNFKQESKKNISIKKEFESIKDTFIESDPFQIKEVFINLLNNAYDAVSHPDGLIEIKAYDDNESIKIHIKDNGVGISKENSDKVFEPFFSTKSKGTGLGLSVCYQIISLHSGTINIESEPGKGTTVIISLPKRKKFTAPSQYN